MMKNFIRSLGSADWRPTKNNDNSCYTLDDRVLIDTGSAAGITLINQGIDPTRLTTICFTHMHADHCIGLPQLLLYWRIMKGSLGELTIAGPRETVRAQFMRAFQYVFHDSEHVSTEVKAMPRILELSDGDSFETEDYFVQVIASHHAVPGLFYRFTDKVTGKVACFSCDTYYRDTFGPFCRDADILVHEASAGAGPVKEYNPICLHSSALEARQVAAEGNVKQLILTHSLVERWESAVQAAAETLSIPVYWAEPLKVFEF